ncbi:MAG: succinylglutamate desuccinylase/aspartoacylase family protein [Ferruginibacter sp.]|nr:succinylglutamate desuccinylase/aspartoacylase family protein [Rhodoferax sp.]
MVSSNRPRPLHSFPAPLKLCWQTASAAAVLALVACSSTPLQPWRPPTAAVVAPQPAVTRAAPAATTEAPAIAQPVPPASITQTDAPDALTPDGAPYSAAVAARFADPAIAYSTPGLQPGRTSYSSNAEIGDWLAQLTLKPSRGVHPSVLRIGLSQQGVPLEALLLTRANSPDAPSVIATGRPTVMIVAQQHGNEPAGSEAALVVARELAQGLLEPLLDKINVLIVPRANPDGAAVNQRTTANGIDMNRDHLLLNSPEARALAQLGRDYQPTVVLDAHEYTVVGRYLEKFGAIQKFDALLQYAMTANLPEFLTRASEEWYRRPAVAALKSQGLSSEWYYTTSTDIDDHVLSMGGTQPDTGRNVNGLKNTVSMLVESRGVGIGRLHIQRRVHTQVTAMVSMLQSTATRAEQLATLRSYIDREVSSQACRTKAIVAAGPTNAQYDLTMLNPTTGADKKVSVDWNSALELQTLKSRVRPCGYWLSAASTAAVDRLQLLGVQVMRVVDAGTVLGELYRATGHSTSVRQDVRGGIADAQPIVQTEVELVRGLVDTPQGSFYVPMGQPLANLVLAALEPDTQNSYYANHILANLGDTARIMAEPSAAVEKLP